MREPIELHGGLAVHRSAHPEGIDPGADQVKAVAREVRPLADPVGGVLGDPGVRPVPRAQPAGDERGRGSLRETDGVGGEEAKRESNSTGETRREVHQGKRCLAFDRLAPPSRNGKKAAFTFPEATASMQWGVGSSDHVQTTGRL